MKYLKRKENRLTTIGLIADSDLPGRRRLRSSSTLELFVPSYRLTTTGRPVARFLLQPQL